MTKKITELGGAGTITGTEIVPVVQNGVTVQTTISSFVKEVSGLQAGTSATIQTANVAAINAAIAESQAAAVSFQPTGGSYIGAFAAIDFPAGHFRINAPIACPGYFKARCGGRVIIEQTDPTKDVWVLDGGYVVEMEGIATVGGARQFVFGNPNTDSSTITLDRGEWQGATDVVFDFFVTAPATNLSCVFECKNSKIIKNKQIYRGVPGLDARFSNTWVYTGLKAGMIEGAQFDSWNVITFDRMYGVPAPDGPPVNGRWVNVRGGFFLAVNQTRFGGEGAGMPVVYNYAGPERTYPYNLGGSIIFENSTVAIGPTGNAKLIHLVDNIPQAIRVVGCNNITRDSGDYITVDPALNLTTYINDIPDNVRCRIDIESNQGFVALEEGGIPAALLTTNPQKVAVNTTYAGWGSATEPSISMFADTGTGFWRRSAGIWGFAGRLREMLIERLEVIGAATTDACLYLTNTAGGGRRWRISSGQEGVSNQRLVLRDITGSRDWLVCLDDVVDAAGNRSLQVAQGLMLQNGSTIWSAAAAPSANVGANGDWALCQNGNIYFKSAGAWAVKV